MSMLNEARRGSITDDRDRSLKGRIKEIVPWKGDDIKEILRKLVFIVAIGVLVYSVYDAYIYKFGSQTMIQDQQNLSDLFHNPGDDTPQNGDEQQSDPAVLPDDGQPDDDKDGVDEPVVNSKYPAGMLKNFEKLYDINPDIVGWISIDGIYLDEEKPEDQLELAINNPVYQSADNDFYLSHDYSKAEAEYGALFVDYRANSSLENRSDNVIIYGHNMGTGYFFAKLHRYKNGATFLSEHRTVDFYTLTSQDQYVIFACFLVCVNEEDDNQPLFRYHNCINFKDEAAFDYWYKNVLYRNYYISDIDCDINDEYLTLSTCSTEVWDSRFVVVARKLREGEDPNSFTYKNNPNPHKPAKLYTAYGNEPPKDNGPDYEIYVPE